MMMREELDMIYEKMWRTWQRGSDALEHFCTFLEGFIPFSQRGFALAEKRVEGGGSLVYLSQYIRLEISPDFERYPGMGGSINFLYSRPESPISSRERGCWPYIVSRPGTNLYLHCFLDRIPQETAPKDFSQLPVQEAFEKMRSLDELLKELREFEPAYAAAFESFCWEYYGERLFRLFYPENQSERDALAQYVYEYYKANYPPETIKEWEERWHSPPPWKICL